MSSSFATVDGGVGWRVTSFVARFRQFYDLRSEVTAFAVTSRIGGATQDEGGKPISEGVVKRGMAVQ
jgi:hypothetical protein